MKRTLGVLRWVLAVVLLLSIVIVALNPLMVVSESQIRKNILRKTPLGTTMVDVLKYLESKEKWSIDYVSYDYGYNRPGPFDPREGGTVGDKSVRVFIGEYFLTSVTVFWGFDENSELIDVRVWKDTDGT